MFWSHQPSYKCLSYFLSGPNPNKGNSNKYPPQSLVLAVSKPGIMTNSFYCLDYIVYIWGGYIVKGFNKLNDDGRFLSYSFSGMLATMVLLEGKTGKILKLWCLIN